jgi:ubiquinone/menaquinone biosynthesis C-methylase UbiE
MPLLDHFSLVAPYYDRIFGRQNADLLLQYVEPAASHRVLDVGGGTGQIAQHFVGLASQVCVVDPSPRMLREGQRRGLCITRGESESLPYASETFDRVIVVDVFHHLRDQVFAARELMRVLVRGGRLVVEEPDIVQWRVRLVALAEKLLLMRSHFLAPGTIKGLFTQYGGHVRIETQDHTTWVIVEKV